MQAIEDGSEQEFAEPQFCHDRRDLRTASRKTHVYMAGHVQVSSSRESLQYTWKGEQKTAQKKKPSQLQAQNVQEW